MEFSTQGQRGHARVLPAGSVIGWWCVIDGKRVVEMTADLEIARRFCQSYNGRDACSELCADACAGAPGFDSRSYR